jgi:hypothetical protein
MKKKPTAVVLQFFRFQMHLLHQQKIHFTQFMIHISLSQHNSSIRVKT